jgi:hypothetical protein
MAFTCLRKWRFDFVREQGLTEEEHVPSEVLG